MFVRSIAAATCIFSLIACAGSEPSSSNAGTSDQDVTGAAPACGANYGKANELYKEAVKTAKQHKTDACGGFTSEGDEGAYLTTIASFASRANATCGAFQNVIKTSQWAAPIREELKGNLALHVLTGDLDVKTFKGLDTALASGITLWGPAPGAYGNASKMEFEADGKVTLSHQVWDDNADGPRWESSESTYSIGELKGDAIKITIGTTVYDLKATTWDNAPDFELRPEDSDAPLSDPSVYTAYISECEA